MHSSLRVLDIVDNSLLFQLKSIDPKSYWFDVNGWVCPALKALKPLSERQFLSVEFSWVQVCFDKKNIDIKNVFILSKIFRQFSRFQTKSTSF